MQVWIVRIGEVSVDKGLILDFEVHRNCNSKV